MSENQEDKTVDVGGQGGDVNINPEDFNKLKEKNQRLQGQYVDLEKKWKDFTSMYKDIDPDEYRMLKGRLEEAEKKAAEKDPAKMEELFERKLKKLRDEFEGEKTTLASQLETLKKQNKTLAVTDKVMGEISALFNQDALRFIKREVEESCDLDDDGTIIIRDESGDILYKGSKPLTIKEYGELLAEKYPSLARFQGTTGSKDLTPGQRAPGGRTNKVPETWAELQAMPNAREVLEKMKRENPAAVQKILRTIQA